MSISISISILIVMLFILGMLCYILYHFFLHQSLQEISNRLELLQPSQPQKRSVDVIRLERAHSHDQLLLLEADLITHQRLSLSNDELQIIDKLRQSIKNCIEELKQMEEWIGLPFDFEWVEILDRLPMLNMLYRKSISEVTILDDLGVVIVNTKTNQKWDFN